MVTRWEGGGGGWDNGGPVLRERGQGEPRAGLGVFVRAGNRGKLMGMQIGSLN